MVGIDTVQCLVGEVELLLGSAKSTSHEDDFVVSQQLLSKCLLCRVTGQYVAQA